MKVPDWVPGIGGKGIDISELPLLKKGGRINTSGGVIVGDAGPELLELPAGAKVTPLSNSGAYGIDYDEMTKSFVNALLAVMPDLQQTVQIIPDEDGIFKVVIKKAREYNRATGEYAFI